MRHLLCFTLLLELAITSSLARTKDKHSGRFGGLLVTATAVESTESEPHQGDRHLVAIYVTIKNAGKQAACAPFTARIKATYGLEYAGILGMPLYRPQYFPPEPRVREMLPGEESTGAYIFELKDGVEPQDLFLKLERPRGQTMATTRCGSSEVGWGDIFVPEEIRLDVRALPPQQRR